MKPTLTDLLSKGSASFRKANAGLLGVSNPSEAQELHPSVRIAQEAQKQPKKRLRQSRDKLNKLETAFLLRCRAEFADHEVLSQAVRLRCGNGAWFKPDVFVPHLSLFIEVKGPHVFRGGFEYLKVAAGIHKWAKFLLVWREKGVWCEQEVLP